MSVASMRVPRSERGVLPYLLLALLWFASGPLWAASVDPAGRVTITLGDVEAVAADGTVRALRRTDPVFEGDTLRTGPTGRAQIRFTDKGLLSLRPDTEIALASYQYAPSAPSTGSQQMNLTKGGFRTMSGEIAHANRSAYRVQTPLAVIGVRGTIWSARLTSGGSLLLGVGQGGISVVNSSGKTAELGFGASYSFLRVDSDGTFVFLRQEPEGLNDNGPPPKGGPGGGPGGGGPGGGGPGGGGNPPPPTGSLTTLPYDPNNPNSGNTINPSSQGSGALPSDSNGPLTGAELASLLQGFAFVGVDCCVDPGVAGGNAGDGSTGAQLLGINVDSNGDTLGPDQAGFFELPPDGFIRGGGTVEHVQTGFTDPGTESLSAFVLGARTDLTTGTGLDLRDSATGSLVDSITGKLLFVTGLPTSPASLIGHYNYSNAKLLDGFYGSSLTDITKLTGIDVSFDVDFGSGVIDNGQLAVFDGQTTIASALFDGSFVKGTSSQGLGFNGGLMTFTSGTFGNDTLDVGSSELGGFFTGAAGEAFAGSFNLSSSNGTDGAIGTFYALRGAVPINALTAAERTALAAGFGMAQSECCFTGRTFQGFVTDPRIAQGQATIIGEGGIDPFDPLFNANPAGQYILRRDNATVVNYGTFDFGAGGQLSSFEWQGFPPNQPYGIYDFTTGDQLRPVTNQVLLLAGKIADVASLTGTGRYTTVALTQGFFLGDTSIPAQPLAGADISFNVDFGTGDIFGGAAYLFTDPSDAGLPSNARSGIEAYFNGQVALSNGNPFVKFDLLGGFSYDSGGTRGGFGLLDPSMSSMTGFFAGDGSLFNLAFNYTSMADPQSSDPAFERINAVGTAVLQQQDLRLTATEATALQQGMVFVGTDCCSPDTGAGGGPAVVTLGTAAPLFGLNSDANGNDLGPLDAGFTDPAVERVIRFAGTDFYLDPSYPVPPEVGLISGQAYGSFGVSPLLVDANTGQIIDRLDSSLLFLAGFPSTIAALQAEGFTTFSGDSAVASGGGFPTLGGIQDTNLFDSDPAYPYAPGASVSFNVDLATGQVTNGHLFAVTEQDLGGPTPQDFGANVFFEGQVGYAAGNTFVNVNIVDGTLFEGTPIDVDNSDIQLFFGGNGTQQGSAIVALGAYSLISAEATPTVIGGTFSIGNSFLPESRLSSADALALSSPGGVRLGLAAYSSLYQDPQQSFMYAPDLNLPIGAEGLLLGRAADASSPSFLLGANALYVVDDGTGFPVPTNTARRGFYDQPFDFVVRQGTASATTPSVNVTPPGGPDFSAQGFSVNWGMWASGGTGSGAALQPDATNVATPITIDRDLFFASVNPTPQSLMPVTGTFTYGGAAAFIGTATGDLSFCGSCAITSFGASFDVDFSNGAISNGQLAASYSGDAAVDWNVGFGGFVNGPIADLQVNSVDLTVNGMPLLVPPVTGPEYNNISGVFTGPAGQRFVGGFSLTGSDGFSFESIQGAFVIDRQ